MRDKKAPDNQMQSQSLAISIMPRFQYLMSHLVCFCLTSEWEISICICQEVKKNVLSTEPLAERKMQAAAGEQKTAQERQLLCSTTDEMGHTRNRGSKESPCSEELRNVGRKD